jgi:hypothetical protein
MGSKTLTAGSVMFVPKGRPYRVVAGPVGLEVLEFRVGNLDKTKPILVSDESEPASIEKMMAVNEQNQKAWSQPKHIGDVAFLQAAYDKAADGEQ